MFKMNCEERRDRGKFSLLLEESMTLLSTKIDKNRNKTADSKLTGSWL